MHYGGNNYQHNTPEELRRNTRIGQDELAFTGQCGPCPCLELWQTSATENNMQSGVSIEADEDGQSVGAVGAADTDGGADGAAGAGEVALVLVFGCSEGSTDVIHKTRDVIWPPRIH
ncbi:Hypothetical predicted protein [Octopus vulgaris]|uniref:Uncharacterized protein n=1 Tax=Octopus vulgaris TaxID=6645 RepID=A0AA36B1R0_OCTVU|nr:Hypothetical predicted protein [Octopus vulgaris]